MEPLGLNRRTPVIISEKKAANWFKDGMIIAIGGLLSSSHPMVLIRYIIKRGLKGLTILAGSAGLELDLLIGAGCVDKVVVSLMTGEAASAVGPMFRQAAEKGRLQVWESEESLYAAGLQAAALGLPFMPCRAGMGTSLPIVNPELIAFDDPIRGERLLAVPALRADLALLHAAVSDPFGNVQHVGTGFGDRALFRAADKVIVQVEKIVPNEQIRKLPEATSIPGADAVVRAPFGAHPSSSPGFYLEDKDQMDEYVSSARESIRKASPEPFQAYLDRYVFGPSDHLDYLETVGIRRLMSLQEF